MFRAKLGTKVIFLFILIGFLPLSVMGIHSFGQMRDSIKEKVDDNLISLSKQTAHEVERIILNARANIVVLADNPIIKSQTMKEEKLEEIQKAQKFYKIFEDITLVDLDGNVMASTTHGYEGEWKTKRGFLEAAGGKTYISDIHIITNPYKVVIVFTTPVVASGEITGVLAGQVKMDEIWEVTENVEIGDTGLVFIMDRNGNFISPDRDVIFSKLPSPDMEITGNGSGMVRYKDENGNGMTGAFTYLLQPELADKKWKLVTVESERESLLVVSEFQRNFIVMSFGTLGVVLLLSVFLTRRLVRPIKRLTRNIEDISMGKLDTEIYPKIRNSRDEIGDLARAFDRTTVSLKLAMKQTAPELMKESEELKKVIGDKKRLEEKLKESEKRFRDILYSMGDWVWETDKNGVYTFASEEVKQVLGYEPEELIGKNPFELMPAEESSYIRKKFSEIASEKKPIVNLENLNLTKEGKRVYMLTNGVPMLDENGELTGYRGVNKDITEQKGKRKR